MFCVLVWCPGDGYKHPPDNDVPEVPSFDDSRACWAMSRWPRHLQPRLLDQHDFLEQPDGRLWIFETARGKPVGRSLYRWSGKRWVKDRSRSIDSAEARRL